MARFFRKNKKEMIVSLILAVVSYFVFNLTTPLQLSCPIDQQMQCLMVAWIIFFLIVVIFFLIIFCIIKLVEFIISKINPKQPIVKKKKR